MRKVLYAAGLVLAGSSLVSCGGGGAPTGASQQDFCNAFARFTKTVSTTDVDIKKQITGAKDAVNELADVGTPEGISDDDRKGFEVFVDTIDNIKDDTSADDAANVGTDLSKGDEANLTSFATYAGTKCSDELRGGQ